ncbi:MAG TPA: CYCXC family (seleno)protein [Gemmatimonadaceae bacterium]
MIRPEHRVAAWVAVAFILGCTAQEQPSAESAAALQSQPAPSVESPVDAALPNKVLDPAGWSDPQVRRAYAAAKQYAHVLEKIYCYCRCKENIGHRALVECFESDHGANCDVCMTEALTVARMTEQGKTPEEIQKAIDAFYAG